MSETWQQCLAPTAHVRGITGQLRQDRPAGSRQQSRSTDPDVETYRGLQGNGDHGGRAA
jgi:hypothetical protein